MALKRCVYNFLSFWLYPLKEDTARNIRNGRHLGLSKVRSFLVIKLPDRTSLKVLVLAWRREKAIETKLEIFEARLGKLLA